MTTVTTDELLDKMITVINGVPRECRPQHYHGDIIHDIRMVYRDGFQTTDKWVWFIGEMGTHIAKDRGMFEAIRYSYGDYAQYYWDGHNFKGLDQDEECPLEWGL